MECIEQEEISILGEHTQFRNADLASRSCSGD